MTLGEKIRHLRKRNNISQDDLANELDVSRQSVSKWETDTSIPELGKLIRMGEVFNVTLDELIRGEEPDKINNGPENSDVNVERSGLAARKIVGLIILGVGLVAFLLLSLLGGLFFALIFSSPLLVCAAICLIVSKHTALWCSWALYVLIFAYLRYATGIRPWWIFHEWLYRSGLEIHAMIAWAMSLVLAALIVVTSRLFYGAWKSKR